MAKVLALISSAALFTVALPAFAQAPTTATAEYPSSPEATAPGSVDASTSPAGTAAPPVPPQTPTPPPPTYAQPQPQPQPTPPAVAPAAPPPNSYSSPAESSPPSSFEAERSSGYTEPLPPPAPDREKGGRSIPEFSIRVDPLNWLLAGRLGFELEVAAWEFITVETIPIFVADTKPPLLNLGGIPDTLSQHSNGLGALAGASIGAGFWLNGKPFQGNVLRFYYTNYGFSYEAKDDIGKIDSVKHTERFLVGMFGSHSKWGPFTIATGLGLGVEMNRERRCIDASGTAFTTSGCSDDEIRIQVRRSPADTAAITGGFHPVYLLGRLSLGFVF